MLIQTGTSVYLPLLLIKGSSRSLVPSVNRLEYFWEGSEEDYSRNENSFSAPHFYFFIL